MTENKDMLSANNLEFEERPFDKSLIWMRKNNGPRTEPCGTPVVTLAQEETYPFNTTLYFQLSKKYPAKALPFCSNLNLTPWRQTLSKAFDISRKTPLTS